MLPRGLRSACFILLFFARGSTVVGAVDAATAARWVKAHNIYRCMHGSPRVGWSDAAANAAQKYVNTLTSIKHSNAYALKPPAGPAGENLGMGFSRLEDVVGQWHAEYVDCNWKDGCATPKTPGKMVGHFTAVVWKGVTEIGCAESPSRFYICRYRSGDTLGPWTANMAGGGPTNVFPKSKSLSECQASASSDLTPPPAPSPAPAPPAASPVAASPMMRQSSSGSSREGKLLFNNQLHDVGAVAAAVIVVLFLVMCFCNGLGRCLCGSAGAPNASRANPMFTSAGLAGQGSLNHLGGFGMMNSGFGMINMEPKFEPIQQGPPEVKEEKVEVVVQRKNACCAVM